MTGPCATSQAASAGLATAVGSDMQIELHPAELLTAIHSHISKQFFDKTKHSAKRLFLAIQSGKEIPFMTISRQGRGEVSCTLALDHDQFVGKLGFSVFRSALASHLSRTASKLENQEELNIFTKDESCDMIFHIPGFVETGGKLNILVTGVRQKKPGIITARLIFLDPGQFATQTGQEPVGLR